MARRRTTVKSELEETAKNLTWEDAVNKFMDSMKLKGLAYHTKRWHKENLQAIEKLLKSFGNPTEPAMITDKMLQQVFLQMIDNLSPTTVNHRIRSIKQLYQFLKDDMLVSANPAEKLSRKKPKSQRIEAFSEAQVMALLGIPDKSKFVGLRDYVMMLFLLDTGIRVSELADVKLQDLKLADNELIIPHGKGNKARRVFVSPRTREALLKYLRIRGDIPGTKNLFVTREDKPMASRCVQERITIYGRMAKLEGVRVSPHTFRHTFAKMYIMHGGDPFSLQSLLGHSTLDMVRHYVNLWGSDLQKMHRKFSPVDNLLNSPGSKLR